MKTRYAKQPCCVPNLAGALQANVIPPHYQRNPIVVELDDGSSVKTCHLMTDGRLFNFRNVYDNALDWDYGFITQLSYMDATGNTQMVEVDPRNPHPIDKSRADTVFGYTTKINEKRWGVLVKVNWLQGSMQITTDQGSPITGVLIQLIK